jgi:hypothetical protein
LRLRSSSFSTHGLHVVGVDDLQARGLEQGRIPEPVFGEHDVERLRGQRFLDGAIDRRHGVVEAIARLGEQQAAHPVDALEPGAMQPAALVVGHDGDDALAVPAQLRNVRLPAGFGGECEKRDVEALREPQQQVVGA